MRDAYSTPPKKVSPWCELVAFIFRKMVEVPYRRFQDRIQRSQPVSRSVVHNITHDRLTTVAHVNMLDRNTLMPVPPEFPQDHEALLVHRHASCCSIEPFRLGCYVIPRRRKRQMIHDRSMQRC
jgi:hypothetical protein